jgi:hypothetical protein
LFFSDVKNFTSGDLIMRAIKAFLVTAGLLASLTAGTALRAEENHKAEALKHALAAAESGQKGDAAAAGEHAKAAKVHAEAAEKEKANPHVEAGIKNLNESIEHAKLGHAQMAGESAEAAATHLKAAEKSM